MEPTFFTLEDGPVMLYSGLEGVTEVGTDLKCEVFTLLGYSTPLMADLSVFMPLPGIAAMKIQKYIEMQKFIENKNEENGNKKIFRGLICTMDKIDTNGWVKTEKFYKSCSYYALNMNNGVRTYGESWNKISMSSSAMIGPLSRIQDRKGLY